jgi:hypothetical protein
VPGIAWAPTGRPSRPKETSLLPKDCDANANAGRARPLPAQRKLVGSNAVLPSPASLAESAALACSPSGMGGWATHLAKLSSAEVSCLAGPGRHLRTAVYSFPGRVEAAGARLRCTEVGTASGAPKRSCAYSSRNPLNCYMSSPSLFLLFLSEKIALSGFAFAEFCLMAAICALLGPVRLCCSLLERKRTMQNYA